MQPGEPRPLLLLGSHHKTGTHLLEQLARFVLGGEPKGVAGAPLGAVLAGGDRIEETVRGNRPVVFSQIGHGAYADYIRAANELGRPYRLVQLVRTPLAMLCSGSPRARA